MTAVNPNTPKDLSILGFKDEEMDGDWFGKVKAKLQRVEGEEDKTRLEVWRINEFKAVR